MATHTKHERGLRLAFWTLALTFGAGQAWMTRQQLSSDDAIAYLDIGDAYMRGDWHTAINAYWSPLYSWLLAAAMAVLRPTSHWEFPVVKLVDFAIYVFTLAAFDSFLREAIAFADDASDDAFEIPRTAWLVLGYAMFLWTSLAWIGVSSDTPDMLVAAFVYLAAGLTLRIRASASARHFAALGAVLALGYLAKAAMFPVAIVFIAVAFLAARGQRRAGRRALASLLVFSVFAGPFIAAISIAKGRATFGETGRLNYAWQVTRDVRPFRFWQGQSGPGGAPVHAPRLLAARPEVFEFAAPVGGTYPPWQDPSYWYEGLETRFRPATQLAVLRSNLVFYGSTFVGLFVVSWLAAVGLRSDLRQSLRATSARWFFALPALAGLGIYLVGSDLRATDLPTQPSSRFVAAYVVLLFVALLGGVRRQNAPGVHRRLSIVAFGFLSIVVGALAFDGAQRVRRARGQEARIATDQARVADRLRALGLHVGDPVAVLGFYLFPYDHWARLARARVVAEIFLGDLFWEQEPSVRDEIIERVRATGAVALVQRPRIPIPSGSAWQSIGGGYYALFLSHQTPLD